MATVQLADVRKVYAGGVEAVKGISLDIPDGAMCVLVGPSGCGKSTLLRMVAGLEEISSGDISIGPRKVNDLGPAERDIAMVFQNYALYPHMNVYDNMAYGLRNRKVPKAEIESRVREAAATLELSGLLDRKPRQLSGGQRQRVAMGRAIVRSPQAFLFDEPLSNLDAKLRGQMRVEINNLQRRLGITSLYVTHDQVEAMTLADTLVVMNGGVAEQIGSALDIYERPATTFVAGFMGAPAMNLIHATVSDDATFVLGDGERLKANATGLAPGRKVTIGIRPEHIQMIGQEDGRGIVLRVGAVELLGADALVHGTLAGGAPFVVRLAEPRGATAGDYLQLCFADQAIHVFDRDTGNRLPRMVLPEERRSSPGPVAVSPLTA